VKKQTNYALHANATLKLQSTYSNAIIPTGKTFYKNSKNNLQTICTKHQLDPHLYQMWWLGFITNDPHNTIHTIDLHPPFFHPIFQHQQQLGWKQLFYGQITKQPMDALPGNLPASPQPHQNLFNNPACSLDSCPRTMASAKHRQ